MKLRMALAVLAAGIVWQSIAPSGRLLADGQNSSTSWFSELAADNPEGWAAAEQSARDDRANASKSLCAVVGSQASESNREQIATAIRISGLMRSEGAVAPLLDKIDFLEFKYAVTSRPASPTLDYLAVKSLIDIGDPAVEPCLHHLASDPDTTRQVLYAVVIKHVLGVECARLKLEAEKNAVIKSGAPGAPLERALSILDRPDL